MIVASTLVIDAAQLSQPLFQRVKVSQRQICMHQLVDAFLRDSLSAAMLHFHPVADWWQRNLVLSTHFD